MPCPSVDVSMNDSNPTTPHAIDALGRNLRDLRISVTDRCNFRCPYCMPEEIYGESYRFLPKPQLLTFEEIHRLARLFVESGVEKIRITGGEPLLRHGLPSLIAQIATLQGVRDIALTTNGVLLARQAAELADAGLQRVTVSLDSHEPDVFQKMSGRSFAPDAVFEGIDAAEAAGLGPIKINCVVQRGVNDHQVVDLAEVFKGTGRILRFIEYMDVGTLNQWDLGDVVPAEDIRKRIHARFPLEEVPPSYSGEVATRFRYRDGSGEVGIISSVTKPFCGACTRARLTTEGRLVTCLFASGGEDLRTPLREGASDAELLARIAGTWSRRTDRYSEERSHQSDTATDGRPLQKIEMYEIGG